MSTPDIGRLDLSDSDTEDLFASPTKASKSSKKSTAKIQDGGHATSQRNGESKYDAEEARDAALRRELQSVRSINEVIEGVLSSLECAKGNMETVSRTVTSAATLLDTWTHILSQTEHNQRLILNPNWKGANQDLADAENETVLKAQAAQRRAAEEERRRAEAIRRAEDEERHRQATGTVRGARGRGRGRGIGRGASSSGYGTSSYNPAAGSSIGRGTSQTSRAGSGSGIGRSSGSVRGRR
ncbi:DASH complex subunit Duo1-domain-containing protein, partial [Amylocarpus encephaloides]